MRTPAGPLRSTAAFETAPKLGEGAITRKPTPSKGFEPENDSGIVSVRLFKMQPSLDLSNPIGDLARTNLQLV
jgi:hypothetical protein